MWGGHTRIGSWQCETMHSFLFLLQALLQRFRVCVACPGILPSCDMLCTQENSTFRTADCKASNVEPQRECTMGPARWLCLAAFYAWTTMVLNHFLSTRCASKQRKRTLNATWCMLFFACFSASLLSFLYFLFSFMCVFKPNLVASAAEDFGYWPIYSLTSSQMT